MFNMFKIVVLLHITRCVNDKQRVLQAVQAEVGGQKPDHSSVCFPADKDMNDALVNNEILSPCLKMMTKSLIFTILI